MNFRRTLAIGSLCGLLFSSTVSAETPLRFPLTSTYDSVRAEENANFQIKNIQYRERFQKLYDATVDKLLAFYEKK